MSIGDHLEELRWRIFAIAGVLLLFAIACGVFSFQLHDFLIKPYHDLTGLKLLLGNAYGPLEILIKLSIMAGLTLSLPLVIGIAWGFVTPALQTRQARYGYGIILASSFLFWGGLFFCWYYIFPLSLKFLFIDMLPPGVQPQLTMEKYYSFLFLLHTGSGLFFQLPLIVILLGALEIVPLAWHGRSYKYVVVSIFIIGAIVTPPDPLSQIVLSCTLLALYGISLGVVFILETLRGRRAAD
jgi:sec-independent protein translocase protein TatC